MPSAWHAADVPYSLLVTALPHDQLVDRAQCLLPVPPRSDRPGSLSLFLKRNK